MVDEVAGVVAMVLTVNRRMSTVASASALCVAALAGCSASPAGPHASGSRATSPSAGASMSAGPAPASGASSTGASSSTAPPDRTTITLAASGDILVHYPVQTSAAHYAGPGAGYDFTPMFADVRPQISAADVAICHQETPISAKDTNLTRPGILVFNAPREIAPALKSAGFDGCDTASNHLFDHGIDGIRQTNEVLRAAGLKQAGPSATAAGAGKPALYDVKGVMIANLAYTYTLVNDGSPNKRVPPNAPWLERALWPADGATGIIRDAKAARAQGAKLVVVSLHAGAEYQQTPTPDQRTLARKLLTSGAVDAILGDHVHVVQPCEKINGRYALYGMGNFLSNQSPDVVSSLSPSNQDGTLNLITFTAQGDGTFSQQLAVQPTFVQLKGHVIRLATPSAYPASWARTNKAVKALGPTACDAKVLR